MTTKNSAEPATETFDDLTKALGNFLSEIAARARREQPVMYTVIDAALESGESYTGVTVKIFESGISIRATINRISDGAEQAVLEEVDGVARVFQ